LLALRSEQTKKAYYDANDTTLAFYEPAIHHPALQTISPTTVSL